MKYKHVIWDWNGTLLNDVELGHYLLNYLQKIKNINLSTFNEYRAMFTFPITDFYKEAGLFEDMESFAKQADIYIRKYEEEVNNCALQDNAEKTLSELHEKGITSSILTASPEDIALNQLTFYNIEKYFIALTGKKDFYAAGKSELIDEHLSKIGYAPKEIVFVGDTLHDMEIADKIGCDCILVMNGHQDISRFIADYKQLLTALDLNEVSSIVLEKE